MKKIALIMAAALAVSACGHKDDGTTVTNTTTSAPTDNGGTVTQSNVSTVNSQ